MDLEQLQQELEEARRQVEAARQEVETARREAQAARQEVEAARQEARQNWDQFLRARADLDNYRRRMERETERMVNQAKQDLLCKVLEVVDNFQRALLPQMAVSADPDGMRKGVEMIARQMENVLAQEGVEPIEAVGKAFDPRLHDAVAVWESEELQEETVTDEIQKGYLYRGELLRPARVRVGRPSARTTGHDVPSS